MATITTAGTGDYSSTTPNAPWPSGTIPDYTTDTVVVKSGHVLTISDTRTVPAISICDATSSTEARLIVASTAVVTMNGQLTINGGASANSKAVLELVGGSRIDFGANVFALVGTVNGGGYAKFYTSGTSANNRATITGNGAKFTSPSPFSFVNISYLTCTGFNSSVLNLIAGRFEFSVTNCLFYDCSSISFGDGSTATTLSTYLNNNSFRRIIPRSGMPVAGTSITVSRATGVKTGDYEVKNNTIDYGRFSITSNYPTDTSGNIVGAYSGVDSSVTTSDSVFAIPALFPAIPAVGNGSTTMQNSGVYTESLSNLSRWYRIEIEAGGTTFKWVTDTATPPTFAGTYTTGVALSTSYITLDNGVQIKFSATSATTGDSWTFHGVKTADYIGGVVGALNNSIAIMDSHNNHGIAQASTSGCLFEYWGSGGNDAHLFSKTINQLYSNNIYLGGVGVTAWNLNGQLDNGKRVTLKNNTILSAGSSYIGLVLENSYKTGRIKLSSNITESTAASGTVTFADMTNTTHREVDYTDYNLVRAPSATVDKYKNMVIPVMTSPEITSGTPTKTLSSTGNYSGATDATYTVTVDAGATTYTWACSTGGGAAGVAIGAGGAYQTLNNEVYINWGTTGTLTAGDAWSFTAGILTSDPDANPVANGGLNDLSPSIDPQFVDKTRSIAKFMTTLKGAYDNDFLARRDFFLENLKKNGFDYAGQPATYDPAYAPSAALAYVFEGFRPQNATLATAGEAGTYVGAVEYVAPAGGSAAAFFMGY